MILYVIRHAKAVERSKTLPDEWRYLTKNGRSAVKKIRAKIAQYGEPSLILTSPLVRTVQTAEILAEGMRRKNVLIASELLQPGADIKQLIKYLKKHKDSECVMLVGHEPFLGFFVSELLGQTDCSINLKKGACIALKTKFNKIRKSRFLWYMAPGKKRIAFFNKAFFKK